ncbi:uncharacterized protein [Centruroides vittatus]|uniref:uncharacterized protein n=1 Tax=Centruroides vittatus TaxID=120091 RepID=UPI0035105C61
MSIDGGEKNIVQSLLVIESSSVQVSRLNMAKGFDILVYWRDILTLLEQIERYRTMVVDQLAIVIEKISRIENILNSLTDEFYNVRNLIEEERVKTRMLEKRITASEKSFSDIVNNPMPLPYSGTTNFDNYLVQFEKISVLRRWNYDQKGVYLAATLSGKARNLLLKIPKEKIADYKSL